MTRSIAVENVTKCYQLGEARHTMLRDALMGAFGKLLHRKKGPGPQTKWALNGVSFEVEQGEVVGIIGRNGAGKSTLLKVLSRITYPTSGQVEVNGRVGSLLEVGTGFHDELTGRENIYMNGSILGMRKKEIDAAMDQIVAFADVDQFLDTPVKRYSSGMRMRLGFAVAAHLRTDVLFVDEVLAVGDIGFQKKCLGTMRELGSGGRTIIFVSHNMAAIENLCKRTIWIADGKVKEAGDTRQVIRSYLNSFWAAEDRSLDLEHISARRGTGTVRLLKMEFLHKDGSELQAVHSGDALRVRFQYECERDIPSLDFGLRIYSNLGVLLSDVHTWSTDQAVPLARKGKGSIELEIDFLNLMPGTYYLGAWVASDFGIFHDELDNVAKLDVEACDYYGTGRGIESRFGLMFFPFRWSANGDGGPVAESATEHSGVARATNKSGAAHSSVGVGPSKEILTVPTSETDDKAFGQPALVHTVHRNGSTKSSMVTVSRSLISVIIPTYNSARFLRQAVDSVLAQDYRPIEVIVVDDGSNDGSEDALAPYGKEVRYLRQTNQGPAAARNLGIKNAIGEWLAFLDADDQWLPGKLSIQAQVLSNHPNVGLVHTDSLFLDDATGRLWHEDRTRERYSGKCYEELFWRNAITTSSVLLRRACLEKVGVFDSGPKTQRANGAISFFAEDYDLWMRLARDYELQYVAKQLVTYRFHGSNNSRQTIRMIENELYVIERALRMDQDWEARLGKDAIVRRLFRLLFGIGHFHFDSLNKQDRLKARKHLAEAARLGGDHGHARLLWLATFLPLSAVRTLQAMKKLARRRR
jgi:lipopolysaccharide transport system ATP-binding protein